MLVCPRSSMLAVLGLLLSLSLADGAATAASSNSVLDQHQQPQPPQQPLFEPLKQPSARQLPIPMPVAARAPHSRLFVGPLGSLASVVSSLGSVGVLGVFLLFMVFLPYLISLFFIPMISQGRAAASRSLGETTSYYNNKHKILETLTFLEELWRKFDARDPECQKSLLCQLHVEEDNLGYLGKRAAKTISYLMYLDGVEMPQVIKSIVSGYTQAIRKGRDEKSCPYSCGFSLTDTLKKMNDTSAPPQQ